MSDVRRTNRLLRVLLLCALLLQVRGVAAASDRSGASQDEVAVDSVAPARPATPATFATTSSTTTSTAPPAPTTTTTAPPPPPAPAPAPSPAPATAAPAPPAPAPSALDRVKASFEASVPAAWRGAIPVRFEIISGSTSWGNPDGLIQVSSYHANGSATNLSVTLAHEFGHLIAFHYGSQAYNGAAPEGWPSYSSNPAEAWADCVALAFTGINDPSHGLPPCGGSSLSWTSSWLGQGPGSHQRTW